MEQEKVRSIPKPEVGLKESQNRRELGAISLGAANQDAEHEIHESSSQELLRQRIHETIGLEDKLTPPLDALLDPKATKKVTRAKQQVADAIRAYITEFYGSLKADELELKDEEVAVLRQLLGWMHRKGHDSIRPAKTVAEITRQPGLTRQQKEEVSQATYSGLEKIFPPTVITEEALITKELSDDNRSSHAPTYQQESFTLSETDETDGPERQLPIAGATTDPVRDYLKQIGKVPLLNAAQEVELSKRIEAGLFAERVLKGHIERDSLKNMQSDELVWIMEDGQRAKAHLTEANLRLVISLAKRYLGRGMPFLDIIQEGNMGLIRAVEKFDYQKGFKFSTYASWWIRQAITRSMADQSRTIRVPAHMFELMNKLRGVQRGMLQDLNREPTPEELAVELDITPEKVKEVQSYGRESISLHSPLGNDGDGEFGDLIEDAESIAPDEAAINTLRDEAIQHLLDSSLDKRDFGIILMRYGLDGNKPRTLDEIGKVYGITRERIRQLENKAEAKLKPIFEEHGIRPNLD